MSIREKKIKEDYKKRKDKFKDWKWLDEGEDYICNQCKGEIQFFNDPMSGSHLYFGYILASGDEYSFDTEMFDVSDIDKNKQERIVFAIRNGMKDMPVPLKTELFILHKIVRTDGYYKEIIDENGNTEIEFKCLDDYALPFVLRKFLGEDVTENDKIFYHEGLLAKFIETPQIEVNIDEKN